MRMCSSAVISGHLRMPERSGLNLATDVTCPPDFSLWPPEENPFENFQTEQEEFERQLMQSFDELESYRAELEAESSRLAKLEEELAGERAALNAEREKLQQQQAEIESQRENAPAADTSAADTAAMAEVTEKLTQAEQEIETLREQLSNRTSSEDRHREERKEHEEQYSALELELEHVRNRAGELSTTLSSARSDWDRERVSWEQERKELKALLSQQQDQIQDYLSRHETNLSQGPHAAPDVTADEDAQNTKEDAVVVGSVLAQFERIRNERAIRRRKANGQ